jgi:peroxiredoxin Q/BCP|uniref:thioredoxin-dependent peroxiredoxin n=1 Tax=Mesoaciditoga lauensis TaxID=1495039 RepID=A0A7V3VT72_9BACT
MLKVGDKAPEFCLKDQDGQNFCLKELLGKWIVLYFYPKDNTPGCTAEAITFTESIDEFTTMKAEIIGVSADTIESHKKFIEKRKLRIKLLSDPERKVIALYDAKGMLGTVRSTFLIDPEGKIAKIWPRVSVKGHSEDVKDSIVNLRVKS